MNYELDLPIRTTYEYSNPKVSASLQAVLAEAMQTDNDTLDITDHSSYMNVMKSRLDKITRRNVAEPPSTRVKSSVNRGLSPAIGSAAAVKKVSSANFPKARGLIPK
jgi:kinesin family protein 3/17